MKNKIEQIVNITCSNCSTSFTLKESEISAMIKCQNPDCGIDILVKPDSLKPLLTNDQKERQTRNHQIRSVINPEKSH